MLFLKEHRCQNPNQGTKIYRFLFFFDPLTPLIIFATKSLGFPDPSPFFEGIVGTEEDFDFEKIWSRKRYVAAAATPTPTTMASGDTDGILEVNRREKKLERGRKPREKRKRAVDERKERVCAEGAASTGRSEDRPREEEKGVYIPVSAC